MLGALPGEALALTLLSGMRLPICMMPDVVLKAIRAPFSMMFWATGFFLAGPCAAAAASAAAAAFAFASAAAASSAAFFFAAASCACRVYLTG